MRWMDVRKQSRNRGADEGDNLICTFPVRAPSVRLCACLSLLGSGGHAVGWLFVQRGSARMCGGHLLSSQCFKPSVVLCVETRYSEYRDQNNNNAHMFHVLWSGRGNTKSKILVSCAN